MLVRKDKSLAITVSTVEASEKLLRCISALMIGGNEVNQNFIIDSKYPEIITEVLKIENVKLVKNQVEMDEREKLIQQVLKFYQQNGIDLSDNLRSKMAIFDFNHLYVLNRIKYMLLRTLVECVAGNERAMSKIKFQVPIELLKINLIWVYEEYKLYKVEYTDETILRVMHDWNTVIHIPDLNGSFLMIGFYLYYLISNFGLET